MTDHPKITGLEFVTNLPDDGPWRLGIVGPYTLVSSAISGVWRLVQVDGRSELRPVEMAETGFPRSGNTGPPVPSFRPKLVS